MSDDLDRHEAAWLRGELDSELRGLGARPEALQRVLARAGATGETGIGTEPGPPAPELPQRSGGGRRRLPPWMVAAAAVAAVAAAVPVVRAARDGLGTANPASSGPSTTATVSSASPSPTRNGVPPVPPATSASPTPGRGGSVAPTGSPGASATSTNAAGPARCDVPTLVVSVTGPDGAAGTIYHTLVLTNAGEQACYLEGFPGVAATDGTTTVDAKRDTRVPATKVVLQPGGAAHAVLAVRNVPSSTAPCPAYNHLRVTAPDSRRTTSIPLQVRPCDGVMTVGVVQPGAG